MPISPQNVLAHEWIGLSITIKNAKDHKLNGLSGIVRDETRNTFLVETSNKIVHIVKSNTQFELSLPEFGTQTIQGELLRYRPEDRVKRGLAKW